MKTSPTSLKVRQLITLTKDEKLVPNPEFQRRLVWTSIDKMKFIDTILRNYPFPEIYVANGPVNLETGEGQQLLVDGQQRVTTIVGYFQGDSTTSGSLVPPYSALDEEQKKEFLNYDVAVRDLGSIPPGEIIEVFRRINSTRYSLNEIEVNNAVYAGALMQFASGLSDHDFFDDNKVFRATDIKRMGDVRFVLLLTITMLDGYFNRDDAFEKYLSDYNEDFPMREEIAGRIIRVMDFITECGFLRTSRIWKRSDLFTAMTSIDNLLQNGMTPTPSEALDRMEAFYRQVDEEGMNSRNPAVAMYSKVSLQASNDRINRIRRGVIMDAVLIAKDPTQALKSLDLI